MLRYIFDAEGQLRDKYQREADQRAGAWSILTGIAANRSMAGGRAVQIAESVPDLALPD